MFNANKKKKVVSNSSTNNTTPSVNIISEGTKIKGNIQTGSDIRISGSITGEAVSKGKIIITDKGLVKGNATSSDADIAGRVEGDIRVTNKLVLRHSAVIDGNIFTKTVIVEEGAQINGSCKMGAGSLNLSSDSDAEFVQETKMKSS
tara:strand:+ start:5443 stop:5883 length:441 start_codon:yes stop_codon:yes gene_type:complete